MGTKTKIWVVSVTIANKNTDRVDEFFPCENQEVANKLYNYYRKEAIKKLNEWSGNDFVTECEEDDHFLGQDNYFDSWIEVTLYTKTLLTDRDVPYNKYGRTWTSCDTEYNLKDGTWWVVCNYNDDLIYCNNLDGILLLAEVNGSKWECYI